MLRVVRLGWNSRMRESALETRPVGMFISFKAVTMRRSISI